MSPGRSKNEFDFEEFINRTFTLDKKQIATGEELEGLCKKAIDIFSAEPSLVEVPAPAFIVGGIGGCFISLVQSIKTFVSLEDDYTGIFLGNYTGLHIRSLNSLKCLTLILAAKCRRPSKFIMLRGKQETIQADQSKLFKALTDSYGEKGEELFNLVNSTFATMPSAVLVGELILCVPGGISPHLDSLDSIRNIHRPNLYISDLEFDLKWATPEKGVEGYIINPDHGGSFKFGEAAVMATCERLSLKLIVCSEMDLSKGCNFFANNKMVQICSKSDQDSAGTAMKVSQDGKIGFTTFNFNLKSLRRSKHVAFDDREEVAQKCK